MYNRQAPDSRNLIQLALKVSQSVDVPAQGQSRGTCVLLHGKNFSGAYWADTIDFLARQGFRVVAPDQIGFGTSTLPAHYQFSFAQLAANAKGLLDELEVASVRVLGHSMGGMLATRFALQYPDLVEQLILLNPIGLEDWRAMGVPHVPVEAIYQAERGKDFDAIKAYQQASYYDGVWKDDYTPWARLLADAYQGRPGKRFAWNMALTEDMILAHPSRRD
ncbi:MAG: alpha/beta fold hydrolase [Oceanococcus sp.]